MGSYGKTLKKIRKSLDVSQAEISKGIMSQSNYSKAENGVIDISFSKMIHLLNYLDMTVDEFIYIHNGYEKQFGKQLKYVNKLDPGNKQKIIENINELKAIKNLSQREKELKVILESLLFVLNNDYDSAKKKVVQVWERLEKHDTWYLYDIKIINNLFFLFSLDSAESIKSLALNRLSIYKDFRNINQTSANLKINFLLLLIENKKYSRALKEVEELILFCIDKKLYTHLGACYVRKGILLKCLCNIDPSPWYKRGFNILEVVRNDSLIRELKKEIQFYTNIK